MAGFGPEEVRRVARLACLPLDEAEATRLAAEMSAITQAFGSLADAARDWPHPREPAPGAPREDEAEAPRA